MPFHFEPNAAWLAKYDTEFTDGIRALVTGMNEFFAQHAPEIAKRYEAFLSHCVHGKDSHLAKQLGYDKLKGLTFQAQCFPELSAAGIRKDHSFAEGMQKAGLLERELPPLSLQEAYKQGALSRIEPAAHEAHGAHTNIASVVRLTTKPIRREVRHELHEHNAHNREKLPGDDSGKRSL